MVATVDTCFAGDEASRVVCEKGCRDSDIIDADKAASGRTRSGRSLPGSRTWPESAFALALSSNASNSGRSIDRPTLSVWISVAVVAGASASESSDGISIAIVGKKSRIACRRALVRLYPCTGCFRPPSRNDAQHKQCDNRPGDGGLNENVLSGAQRSQRDELEQLTNAGLTENLGDVLRVLSLGNFPENEYALELSCLHQFAMLRDARDFLEHICRHLVKIFGARLSRPVPSREGRTINCSLAVDLDQPAVPSPVLRTTRRLTY